MMTALYEVLQGWKGDRATLQVRARLYHNLQLSIDSIDYTATYKGPLSH